MNKGCCSVSACASPAIARGLCWKHYARKRRYGSADLLRRRYRMTHKCRYCGETRPADFYPSYKSVCKRCRKLRETASRQT